MINQLKDWLRRRLVVGTQNDSNRDNWLRDKLSNLPAGSRLLDAGAGEQRFKVYCEHLNYIAQDFAEYDGRGDGSGLQTGTWTQTNLDIISDITKIPEPDQSFDAILCTEVFEHIPDPILALKEFSRLLKPGGQLILTAPFTSGTHFAPYFFYTGFSKYFYEHHLKNYDFHITEITPNGNFFEVLAQETRRLKQVKKQYLNRGSFWSLPIIALLLWLLQRWSRADKNSSDFLCFDLFIQAKKRSR